MEIDDIKKVGVVGAGVMGHGIAFSFALGGYPTIMNDLTDSILDKAMQNIRATADLFVEEGLTTRKRADEAVSRITTTLDLAQVAANSDFITEAITERSRDKRGLFNELDRICPPHTILVSNTSGLVLSDFAAQVKRQDKIAITHYFCPPAIVPGVEVARGPGTSDETFEVAYELMKRIYHIPVRVFKELPGCLLNRIQGAMNREAIRLWAEGVASAEDIELGVKTTFGFRMFHEDPMLHYDLAGIWRWPEDVRLARTQRRAGGEPELSAEAAERIRKRYAEGTPWFFAPEEYEEATAERDRRYIRRLKELYWTKDQQP